MFCSGASHNHHYTGDLDESMLPGGLKPLGLSNGILPWRDLNLPEPSRSSTVLSDLSVSPVWDVEIMGPPVYIV